MVRRVVWLVLGWIVLLALAGPALAQGPSVQHSDPAWQAWYWNNTSLSGPPVLQRTEGELNHDWGLGSPDPAISVDGFSARWARYLDTPAGTYRITATSDDGIRVWVDGILVINEWYDHSAQTFSVDRQLEAGHHLVVVEYYDNQSGAMVRVTADQAGSTVYNWRGEYFNNTSLSGAPVVVRDDPEINFDWGNGSPAVGPVGVDNFSVRWTRTLNLPAGWYRFNMTVDDGGRLWVNDHLLIDAWRVQAPTTYSNDLYLPGGNITIKMEYFEQASGAVARLNWTSGGGPLPPPATPTPVPPPPQPGSGWYGQYYNNRDLAGGPVLVRTDAELNFDWGNGSPAYAVPADNFSARWYRDVYLNAGTYNFQAWHDDGIRVWVDGSLIINAWFDQAATTHGAVVNLNSGVHRIQVDYYEHGDKASVAVWWTGGYSPPPPPPTPPGQGGEVVIDNTDSAFRWGGQLRSRYTAQGGVGGSWFWTYNSVSYPVNYGKWTAYLGAPGYYEILVYLPGQYAGSARVRYRIMHAGYRHDKIINQGLYRDQWVSLGSYYFNARNTGAESILVYDNTGEPYTSRTIAFDAVKFVPRY